jgi:hypothetical protein
MSADYLEERRVEAMRQRFGEPATHDVIEDLLVMAEHRKIPDDQAAIVGIATVRAIQAQTVVLSRIADALEHLDITVELPGGAS